jgi:hypothetical protein
MLLPSASDTESPFRAGPNIFFLRILRPQQNSWVHSGSGTSGLRAFARSASIRSLQKAPRNPTPRAKFFSVLEARLEIAADVRVDPKALRRRFSREITQVMHWLVLNE